VGSADIDKQSFLFAVEKAKTFALIYPQATIKEAVVDIETINIEREEAIMNMLRGWFMFLGPTSSQELLELLHLTRLEIEQTLLRLESTGLILRGSFRSTAQEWCERRLLARIHHLTLGKLRKEIEPVSAAQFMRWLLTWQHLAPGTQLAGEPGLLAVIEQLQGFEIPAKAWEADIFAKRVRHYDPQLLDRLCLMGVVGWGRLSTTNHVIENNTVIETRRVIPTSVAPITFFMRENSEWMPHIHHEENEIPGLGHAAQEIYGYLKKNGASFFTDIAYGVNRLKSEVEMGLWELVTTGIATADGFDNLRSLIDPRRRLIKKKRRTVRHQYSTGRWSLLKTTPARDSNQRIEAMCWVLLKRYGIVFRDLLAREKIIPRWRELLITFRRMEDRGDIRGGRFISGFLGEQFALPYAIESLRAIKRKKPDAEIITISAADPLNLVGYILPGTKVNAVAKGTLMLQDGLHIEE